MNRNLPEPSPWIRTLSLTPPILEDNTADADRLVLVLKSKLGTERVKIDLPLVQKLPAILRTAQWRVRCVLFQDRYGYTLVDVFSVDDTRSVAGLAVDLGTTRVVLRLMDLSSGNILGQSDFENPQTAIGPDILTRIHHADTPEGLTTLHRLIVEGINSNIENLCRACGIPTDAVMAMSLAGNTAMSHLFLGLSPHWIIREPYIPAINTLPVMSARELGLHLGSQARVLIFPNVGSYFGGDLIAGILHTGIYTQEETSLLVDVGTNAEVVLGNRHWLMACAGAAGPALEGGAARMGMPAGPGAIDRIRIDPVTRKFEIHTIEDKPPEGICGSGLIDLAAQLFAGGMIDIRGRFVRDACGSLLTETDGIRQLVIVPAEDSGIGDAIFLSQTDLDSLIRSKAAMYTILRTITETVGIGFSDIDTFYVAGTFGAVIDPESAVTLGMLPDLPRDRFVSIGNSSLEGAALALTHNNCLKEIDDIRDRVTYMELNVNQAFMARFSAAKFLPHTDRSLFPSVKVGIAG